MNKVIFVGRLGRDAEVKTTQAGKTVCAFTVAVDSGYGEHKTTTWYQCRLWGKRAEGQLPQYLVKGTQVAIDGEPRLETWQKQDGTVGAAISVMVGDLDLVGSKQEQAQPKPAQQPVQQPVQNNDFSDDIPF